MAYTSTHPATGKPKRHRKFRTWPLLVPAVSILAVWAIVPLVLTIWYSFQNYNLQIPPPE